MQGRENVGRTEISNGMLHSMRFTQATLSPPCQEERKKSAASTVLRAGKQLTPMIQVFRPAVEPANTWRQQGGVLPVRDRNHFEVATRLLRIPSYYTFRGLSVNGWYEAKASVASLPAIKCTTSDPPGCLSIHSAVERRRSETYAT